MQISLDYRLTRDIRSKIWQTRSKWGSEFHRSDCVYCELKPYCRLVGIKEKPRPRVVEKFVVGEIGHELIQRAFELIEVEKEFDGALVHYDVVHDSLPLEIKTTILTILNQSHIPEEYLEQCIFGLVFDNRKEGLLLTFDLINKILLVWRIKISSQELLEARKRFIRQKEKILDAAKRHDPSLLEPKYDECVDCQYAYKPNGCPRYRGN